MTSLAVRRPAANTTSIREGYVSSPRRNIYSASVNLSVKVLVNQLTRTQAEGTQGLRNHRRWV